MPKGSGAGKRARERLQMELDKFQGNELVLQNSWHGTDVRTDTPVAFKEHPNVQCGLPFGFNR
jgi:hypothetical protein